MKFFSRFAGLLLAAALSVTPLLAQRGPNNPGNRPDPGIRPTIGQAIPTDVKSLIAGIKEPKDNSVYQYVYNLAVMNDPDGNAALISLLKESKSSQVRQSIAYSLALLKKDETVVDALLAALKDPELNVRGGAFQSLCQIGNAKALPAAITYINSVQDVRQKSRLYNNLAGFGAAAVEPLLEIYKTADVQTKPRLLQALAQTRDERVIEPLLDAYNEGDANTKSRLIYSLNVFISNKRVMDALMEAVKSKDVQVSKAAINMIAGQNDPSTIAPLLNTYPNLTTVSKIAMLQSITNMPDPRFTTCVLGIKDVDESVRAQAATTLGLLQNEKAINPLKNLLEKDTSKNVKLAAAFSLSQLGEEGMNDILLGMLDDTDINIKEQVIRTLAMLKEKRATVKIAAMLNDPEQRIKNAAFYAIGMIKDPAAIKAVGQLIAAGDTNVKRTAAQTLGEIGDAKATEYLLPLLNEQDFNIRNTAIRSLGSIKSVESAPVLLILLDEKINTEPNQMWQVQNLKNSVLSALGNIGEPATVPVLLDHAIIKETAQSATFALRTMGKVAAPALIEALNSDNPDKKQVALSAIGGTGATEAVPALVKIADDKANLLTAIAAVRAMGELKMNGAEVADLDKYLDMLNEGAKSADAKMVNDSIRTIGMIKSDKAVGVLSALKAANPQLSNQIYQALGQQATSTAVNTLITYKNEATDVNVKNQIINIIGRTGNLSAMPSLLDDLNNPALKFNAQNAIKILSGEVDEKAYDGTSGRMPRTNREFFGNMLIGFDDATTNAMPGAWGQGGGKPHR